MGDLLVGHLELRHPPAAPVPPLRVADLPHDPPADLRAVDRGTGVGGRLALQLDLVIEACRFLGSLDGHLKLRSLVFLNGDLCGSFRGAIDADRHAAHQPVARGGHAAAEAAVVVGLVRQAFDLFAIGVLEDHGQIATGDRLVVVPLLIDRQADALVVDRLSGPVQRAVGKEHRPLEWSWRVVVAVAVVLVDRRQSLAVMDGVKHHRIPLVALEPEQTVHVGLGRGNRGQLAVVGALPGPHCRVGQRLAGDGVQHEALDHSLPVASPNHQRQIADPELGERDHVVAFVELFVVAGDQVVRPGLEVRRCGQRLDSLLKIGCRREVDRPRFDRRPGQQGHTLILIQLLRLPAVRLDELLEVERHRPQVELLHIAIAHIDRRQRRIPNPLGADLRRAGFDQLDQVVATASSHAVGELGQSLLDELAGLDPIPFSIHSCRPIEDRTRGDFMIRELVDEEFECGLVPRGLLFAECLVVAELQPREVRIKQCRTVVVILMEVDEVLIEADRLERRRGLVGRLGLPIQELRRFGKDRARRLQVERVFRPNSRLLPGGVELQCVVSQEVVQRRAIRIGRIPLLQQVVVLANRDLLEGVRRGQCLLKLLVDLPQNPGQIPRREVLARRRSCLRSLHESPAVLLEVMPVPIGQDRFHDWLHLRRGLGDFGLHAGDFLLGLVPLDVPL